MKKFHCISILLTFIISPIELQSLPALHPYLAQASNDRVEPKINILLHQTIDDCLRKTQSKYELYDKCIGSFSKACFDKNEFELMERDCIDLETDRWIELLEEYKGKLLQQGLLRRNGDAATALINYVESTLQRSDSICGYEVERWPQNALLHQIDGYRCLRNAYAEAAITVFSWYEYQRTLQGDN